MVPTLFNPVAHVAENVGLMRRLSSDLIGDWPIELDSHKRVEFLTRKSCVEKPLAISDEPDGPRQDPVVCWLSENSFGFSGTDGTTWDAVSFPRQLNQPTAP